MAIFFIQMLISLFVATAGVKVWVAPEVTYTAGNPLDVSCIFYVTQVTENFRMWWDVEGKNPYLLIERNMEGRVIFGRIFNGSVEFRTNCSIHIWNPSEKITRLKVTVFVPTDKKNLATAFVDLRRLSTNMTKRIPDNKTVDDEPIPPEEPAKDYGYIGAIIGAFVSIVLLGTPVGYWLWKRKRGTQVNANQDTRDTEEQRQTLMDDPSTT